MGILGNSKKKVAGKKKKRVAEGTKVASKKKKVFVGKKRVAEAQSKKRVAANKSRDDDDDDDDDNMGLEETDLTSVFGDADDMDDLVDEYTTEKKAASMGSLPIFFMYDGESIDFLIVGGKAIRSARIHKLYMGKGSRPPYRYIPCIKRATHCPACDVDRATPYKIYHIINLTGYTNANGDEVTNIPSYMLVPERDVDQIEAARKVSKRYYGPKETVFNITRSGDDNGTRYTYTISPIHDEDDDGEPAELDGPFEITPEIRELRDLTAEFDETWMPLTAAQMQGTVDQYKAYKAANPRPKRGGKTAGRVK